MEAKEKEKEEQMKEQKQIEEMSDQGATATLSVAAKTRSW